MSRPHPLRNAYVLLLAAGLFLWPVVWGLEGIGVRLAWIGLAGCCLAISALFAECAPMTIPLPVPRMRIDLSVAGIAALGVLLAGAFMPVTFFGDEPVLAVPALSFGFRVARAVTWPGLLALSVAVLIALPHVCRKASRRVVIGFVGTMILVAIVAALLLPGSSTLAVRYPPMFHLSWDPLESTCRHASLSIL